MHSAWGPFWPFTSGATLWNLCKELDNYGVLYLQIYPEFQLLDFYHPIISFIQD